LAALEETLGARLVERHPDGLKLTKAGADVVDAALQMNEYVRGLARRVAGADRSLVGTVRVCVPEMLAQSVAEVLATVLTENRQLQIEFRVDDQLVDLSRHETDVAVRVSDAPPADLFGKKLGRANTGVYASERYWATHAYELADERHQWVEWPSYVHRKAAYLWLQREVPARRVAAHASSSQAVLAGVAGGLGLAVMTHVHARRHPGLVSRWALPDSCGTDVWALTHRETSRNARVRAVLAALGGLKL
jgi:DNA-binding transcriptional LysR family regulator